jgi:hypothetical protein
LNQKATTAINQHFDIELVTVLNLDKEDYLYGDGGTFSVNLDSDDLDTENFLYIEPITVF